MELRAWIAAAACLAAVAVLGALIVRGATAALDRSGFALRGRGVRVAFVFTLLGRWPALTILGALAFGIGMLLREGLNAVVALLATQVVSQLANSGIKRLYARPRPAVFYGARERECSYPSGHAVTAIVFFAGFAILAWQAPFPAPVRAALCALLLTCTAGIPWSRVALGAHYTSDVIGGELFGTAWLCALAAIAASAPAYFAR